MRPRTVVDEIYEAGINKGLKIAAYILLDVAMLTEEEIAKEIADAIKKLPKEKEIEALRDEAKNVLRRHIN